LINKDLDKNIWFCITKKPPFYEVEQMNTCTYPSALSCNR